MPNQPDNGARFPPADHELSNDEIAARYGGVIETGLAAFREDPLYFEAMVLYANRVLARRRATRSVPPEIVTYIGAMHRRTPSPSAIARALDADGIAPPMGGRRWNPGTIVGVLKRVSRPEPRERSLSISAGQTPS